MNVSFSNCLANSPIDVFVTYDGKRATDIVASRYATRHLVATEVRTFIVLDILGINMFQIDAKLIVRHAEATERYKTKNGVFGQRSAVNYVALTIPY
jgi:hypothetical protein